MARNKVSTFDFVKVYPGMARAGKSALEIGQALGVNGNDKQIAQFVSLKATGLRKRLCENAEVEAKKAGLDKDQTAALVKASGDKVPGIKSYNRAIKTSEIVAALDAVLAALDAPVVDAPVAPPAEITETAPVAEVIAEVPTEPFEVEDKPKRKRG
jgi:hypothetical protein